MKSKTKVLGLLNFHSPSIEPVLTGTFDAGVRHGIHLEADRLGWKCIYVEPSTIFNTEIEIQSPACYIIYATDPGTMGILDKLYQEGARAVTIGGDGSIFAEVRSDDDAGIEKLMNHLFALGHQWIAMVNVGFGNFSAQRRFAAYCRMMESRNLRIHPTWLHNLSFSHYHIVNQQEDTFKKIFGSPCTPTAVIANGIELSMYLLQTLHRFNVRVPEEVSVCGYDDFSGFEFTVPPLTTIRQPWEEIGRRAVRNLAALASGQGVGHTVLPVELVVRASTSRVSEMTAF